ncbi:hypothetical protein VTI74DRAFT_609 [Chaetomium olivicolor]
MRRVLQRSPVTTAVIGPCILDDKPGSCICMLHDTRFTMHADCAQLGNMRVSHTLKAILLDKQKAQIILALEALITREI